MSSGRTLYVLELEGGYYYVGITDDFHLRYRQHLKSTKHGASFTRKHRPVRVIEQITLRDMMWGEAERLENEKTLEYAVRYSGYKVRGGKYFNPKKLERAAGQLRCERGIILGQGVAASSEAPSSK